GHVRAALSIAPDCPMGLHPLRLVTSSGITELRLYSVGACPEISETEPNGDRSRPQPVTPPVTVNGVITNEDADYFAFDAPANQRINIEIEAMRLGDTLFDPAIALLDARGAVLASADDTTLVKQDAIISHRFDKAGTYTIEVREASYRGNSDCRYRLHIGAFPRPRAVFPPGGRPGETMTLHWLGDDGIATPSVQLAEAARRAEFGLYPQDEAGVAPSPVPFRVNDLLQTLETEPNDAHEQATPLPGAPGAAAGVLSEKGDHDWYRFPATKGLALDFRVYGRALGSPIDAVLAVHCGDGAQLAVNDDAGGPDSALRFQPPEDGDYLVRIRDLLERGGPLFTYRVELIPVTPRLSLATPKTQQHVAVPMGNRNAIVLNATRIDFGGPLAVELTGLPDGVTVAAPAIAPNVTSIPVVLEAAPDAEMDARLTEVMGRHADPNVNITGRLQQPIRLTEFMDRTMASQRVDRLPVAVTKAVPFSIRVDGPHVPLCRYGSIEVVIEAARAEGFTQPIELRVPWIPPGVGAGTVTIAGDQTRAAVHINANPQAALGDWPLVVLGTADVGGPVQVSTPLVRLAVVEPFLQMALERSRVTQGQQSQLVVKLTPRESFSGEAVVELRGLPKGLTSEPRTMTKDSPALEFPLTATAEAAAGHFGGVHAFAQLAMDGGVVRFRSPNQILFVDRPLPPKKEPPKQAAAPAAAPAKNGDTRRTRVPRRPEFRGAATDPTEADPPRTGEN
ncbi:MAG: PPC domain-containing protein, partial [Phycisphaerae bacterium]